MKLKIFAAAFFIPAAFLIALSLGKDAAFKPAEDLPRGALVYVQTNDLPAFVRLWNESKFKERYLESENFRAFQNNHLGLKLASRFDEFKRAAGFPVDAETLSGLAENRAVIALYDVGKLEFVFIAPVSDEIFAATMFAQNQNNFVAETLGDGAEIYSVSVEADRGRQKQKLIFTHAEGRFILATSEKLLAQTLNNINGKNGKSTLSDEPSFKNLSEKANESPATIWVNQTALNDDYYFRRYWLMSDAAKLENIRAGRFDFSMEEGKLIERRLFLLAQPVNQRPIEPSAVEMLGHLPENVPFYKLSAADSRDLDAAIRETIFERRESNIKSKNKNYYQSSDEFEDYERQDYSSLGEKFDETIDETNEIEEDAEISETEIDFAEIFRSADARAVLTFAEPEILPAPLFVEFRRGAIFTLAAPDRFEQETFEAAIEQSFAARILTAAPGVRLKWETKTENNETRRELNLPMLGWQISYARRGDKIFLANDALFLQKIITTRNLQNEEPTQSSFSQLTVLRLDQKEFAYDAVFAKLDAQNAAADFFTGNIRSLLEAAAARTIKIKRNYAGSFLTEEITVNY